MINLYDIEYVDYSLRELDPFFRAAWNTAAITTNEGLYLRSYIKAYTSPLPLSPTGRFTWRWDNWINVLSSHIRLDQFNDHLTRAIQRGLVI